MINSSFKAFFIPGYAKREQQGKEQQEKKQSLGYCVFLKLIFFKTEI